MIRRCIARQAHRHNIRLWKQFFQTVHAVHTLHPFRAVALFRNSSADSAHPTAKCIHLSAERHSDITAADHQYIRSFDYFYMSFRMPAMCFLVVPIQQQFFPQGKQTTDHMLRNRHSISTRRIRKLCTLRQKPRFTIAFRPGIIQLNPFEVFTLF